MMTNMSQRVNAKLFSLPQKHQLLACRWWTEIDSLGLRHGWKLICRCSWGYSQDAVKQTTFSNTGGPGKARRGGWSAARNPGRRRSPRDPEGRSRRVGRALARARGLTKRDSGEGARGGAHPFPGVPGTPPQVQQVAPPGAPLRRVRQPFSRSSVSHGAVAAHPEEVLGVLVSPRRQ